MNPAEPTRAPTSSPRLVSLDALRGFTMFWIVGADALAEAFHRMHGGAVSSWFAGQLSHTEWEGLTFYDLIFPLFVFMVGAAVPFSLDKIVEREGRSAAVRRVIKRGLLLYGLGVLYYGGIAHGWHEIRWVGVLQRLAIGYVAASLLHLWVRPRAIVAVAVALLVGYWALMTFVPVPGFGAGDLARDHNLANWIDAQWLPGKLWYGDYDPEGLLSTLPAIASALIGLFAGRWLQNPNLTSDAKLRRLVVAGVAMLVLGYAWGVPFPIIKRLWTSSYALVTGGWSLLLLALFYQLIDRRGWAGWCRPLVWIGSNALFIYLVNRVVNFHDVSSFFVGGEIGSELNALMPGLAEVVIAVTSIVLSTALCGYCYHRKFFVRV